MAKTARSAGSPLQRRLLALLDDPASDRDQVTAASLAARVAMPVAEVQAELESLVLLGNLTRTSGEDGQVRYSPAPRRRLLGQMLVDAGLISEAQLQEALAEQQQTGERLGRILVDRGYVSKQALGQMLEAQRGIPYLNLSTYPIDEKLVRELPEWVILQHKVVPVARVRQEVHLAMLDPTDVLAIDTVARMLQGRVRPFLTTERDFDWAVTKYLDVRRRVGESLLAVPEEPDEPPGTAAVVTEAADAPPVVRVLNSILGDAVRVGATDIHIEPDADQVRVRMRVDGLLHDKATLPPGVASAVISRLKVLAGVDIAERLRPQDGRILLEIEGRQYDLRLATVGTAYGERAAVRLLNTQQVLLGLERLGLFPQQQAILERLLARPHGMLLVTGPTGSGKTTTLYAALRHINARTRNIMTIEDPVEYRLPGITQIPVREKAGVTFGLGLRAILRQDPDVVMVGEVRDAETATIAVQAALTGHLVLSTLHTSHAAGALVRLLDMGVEPYLLTSSVLAVVGQRLLRVLCTACRRRGRASAEEAEMLRGQGEHPRLFRPAGCPECGDLGYKGRTGIFEIMVMTDDLRELVLQRRPASALQATAVAAGMQTLQESARRKVLEGVTSVEEYRRLLLAEAG